MAHPRQTRPSRTSETHSYGPKQTEGSSWRKPEKVPLLLLSPFTRDVIWSQSGGTGVLAPGATGGQWEGGSPADTQLMETDTHRRQGHTHSLGKGMGCSRLARAGLQSS